MEMEFMAEFTEGMSRDRAGQIIKRKRTKRQRPSSPFGHCLIDNSTPELSPVTSSAVSMEDEEDEDVANCLIMLAQSVSPLKEENHSHQICQKNKKLNARRFISINGQVSSQSLTTSGLCAFECKTCNRTFPSFQALGGHRASHKKPKVNVEEKKSNSMNMYIPSPVREYFDVDHQQKSTAEEEENTRKISSKGKVHECSICGSEFSSGQALGGHMRKHRLISTSGSTMITNDQAIEKSPGSNSNNMLLLDLNFPPPEAIDDVKMKFQFTGSSSQQHIVVSSARALVDCRY